MSFTEHSISNDDLSSLVRAGLRVGLVDRRPYVDATSSAMDGPDGKRRVTALLLVCAAWTLHRDWRGAWRIMRRDGAKHKSPNAGRPEAAMAGALGIRVGGTNFYGGEKHDGQYLGDGHDPIDDQALRNALRLTGCVSLLMFALCLSVRLLVNW